MPSLSTSPYREKDKSDETNKCGKEEPAAEYGLPLGEVKSLRVFEDRNVVVEPNK
jgi:hypothetical protein